MNIFLLLLNGSPFYGWWLVMMDDGRYILDGSGNIWPGAWW